MSVKYAYYRNCKHAHFSLEELVTRTPAVAKKADRTAYDVRYSCRTLNNRAVEICTFGIAVITKLPLSILDVQKGFGQLFTVCF